MKKTLTASLITLAFLLGGCVSTMQQRGLSDGTYVSTSRPAIAVAVPGIPWKTGGFGYGRLVNENMAGALTAKVRTHVYATDARSPMATVTHAELPEGWIWTTVYPRQGAIDEGMEVFNGTAYTAFTYLVPTRNDPFAGVAGEPSAQDGGRPVYWLARYCATITNFRLSKIILEYREPAPEGVTALSPLPAGYEAYLKQFEDRARKAFQVSVPQQPLTADDRTAAGIHWQYMSDTFLGPVMQQDIHNFDSL